MKINYISWNIRGLESPNKKYPLKSFFNNKKNLDFLLLQETKAIGFQLENVLIFVWNKSVFFPLSIKRVEEVLLLL